MTNLITAKQLSLYIRQSSHNSLNIYPEAIHKILQNHGIKPHERYYNGKRLYLYSSNDAKRIITQNMPELIQQNASVRRYNKTSNDKKQFTPRKHGETNAMRQLDKETLWESGNLKKRLYNLIREEFENDNSPEQILQKPFTWKDVDFAEGDIEGSCEQLIVIIKGVKIPIGLINLKAQQTILGKINLHIFIDDKFQKQGIATKIYTSFIHRFGGIYSGFRRMMNKSAILSIYKKLEQEPDIQINYVMSKDGEPIGIEATLIQQEQS